MRRTLPRPDTAGIGERAERGLARRDGQPLVSRQAIISLIAATTLTTGLKVYAQLDEHVYERGIQISDAKLATVDLTPDTFHGEWNYVITPLTTCRRRSCASRSTRTAGT